METMLLEVQTRGAGKKAKDFLRQNMIPGEYYGAGVENQSVSVDYQTFRKLYRVAGTNTLVEMSVDGKNKYNVLVHEVKRDPVTDRITHVDFINVRMDKVIHAKVPVELIGLAPAVKELAGILMHHLHEVEIKCLPKDLIHKFAVDVSGLVDFSSFIRVKDLIVPADVVVLNDAEDVVATVVPPRVEEEESKPQAEVQPGAEVASTEQKAEGTADQVTPKKA